MKRLGIEMPEYSAETDPTKSLIEDVEWTVLSEHVMEIEKVYNARMKDEKKRKSTSTEEDSKDSAKKQKN